MPSRGWSPTEGQRVRNHRLDALKGAAILLVVLGHAIQYAYSDYQSNPVFLFIYSFHMPLFMFLAGAVAYYSFNPGSMDGLLRKAKGLMVPYLAWFLLSLFLIAVLDVALGSAWAWPDIVPSYLALLVTPDNGLWFLYTLFWCFVGLVVITKAGRVTRGASWAILPLTLFAIPINAFGLWEVRWYLPFFLMGFLTVDRWSTIVKYRRHLTAASLLLFPLLLTQFALHGAPPVIAGLYASLGPSAPQAGLTLLDDAYRFLVACTGIVLVGGAILFIAERSVGPHLAVLGTFTLDIYVSHQLFLRFGLGDGLIGALSAFAIALLLSLALSIFVLRRSQYLSLLFLGRSSVRTGTELLSSGPTGMAPPR